MSCCLNGGKSGANGGGAAGDAAGDNERDSGCVKLRNGNIASLKDDCLYHLALGSGTHDLEQMFGDVKYVCMGGSAKRMEQFAHFIMHEIDYRLPTGTCLNDISKLANRYSMYKVGPVLSVNHGMGYGSIGILLHELTKLMYYAKARNPIFIRIGTCGGIGLKPGTVVVTDRAYDTMLNNHYESVVLGKKIQRPAIVDRALAEELRSLAEPDDEFETCLGATMSTNDFYEEQARIDGAFCDHTEQDKMHYLQTLHTEGIRNIEMEAVIFAALTYHAGIRAAIVCVTLLNRLDGDQVTASKSTLEAYQLRPQRLVSRFIRKHEHDSH